MNLVFGSLFLFLLISPGLIFRFSYLQGTYSKLTFKVSAFEEFFWALIPAFFIQVSAMLFVENLLDYSVRVDTIYKLIIGNGDIDFQIIKLNLLPFFIYIFTLMAFSVFLGIAVRRIVRFYHFDHRLKFLRLGNEWFYLFSGEILDPTATVDPSAVLLIQVDVVLNSSEGDIIYSGILEDFYLSKENGLDRIYLRNVYRRNLKDDLAQDKENVGYLNRHLDVRYYQMPGDIFIVSYEKVINMNVSYLMLDEVVMNTETHESEH